MRLQKYILIAELQKKDITIYEQRKHKKKPFRMKGLFGDSVATRTQNLLLRRQLLYPVELRNHRLAPCRDSKIRTCDLLLPKQAR